MPFLSLNLLENIIGDEDPTNDLYETQITNEETWNTWKNIMKDGYICFKIRGIIFIFHPLLINLLCSVSPPPFPPNPM